MVQDGVQLTSEERTAICEAASIRLGTRARILLRAKGGARARW